jgi:hypothetical protein
MWVKLGNDFFNLDNVFRVRINTGFRNGNPEWVAEFECVDPKGQIGVVTRVRGADAQALQAMLTERCRHDLVEPMSTDTPAPVQALTGTVADMNLR